MPQFDTPKVHAERAIIAPTGTVGARQQCGSVRWDFFRNENKADATSVQVAVDLTPQLDGIQMGQPKIGLTHFDRLDAMTMIVKAVNHANVAASERRAE